MTIKKMDINPTSKVGEIQENNFCATLPSDENDNNFCATLPSEPINPINNEK